MESDSIGAKITENAKDPLAPGRDFDSGAIMLSPEAGAAKLQDFASTYHTVRQWEVRANRVRNSMRTGAELDPWPSLAPPAAVVHDQRKYAGYSVENVYFESFPGYYVTGNLYRPVARAVSLPGILINLGHFPFGRNEKDHQVLASTLARMGAVVFIYDMIGYLESHQPQKDNPQQDHNFVKAAKLEILNSLRSLDFLLSLGGIDEDRIGVTGASGGGSRTLFLTALDQRVKASAPVIMVSDYFFGGCVCESGMPICYHSSADTVLADIAAIAAPRPQLIVSDGLDWTATVPFSEFPYIKNVYNLYNAAENVSNVHLASEGHDFGYNKRLAVYHFFAERFGLSPITDEEGTILEPWSLQKAYTAEFPRPANALIGDEAILQSLDLISPVV